MSFTESIDQIVHVNPNRLVGKHSSWERVRLSDIAHIVNGFPFESRHFSSNPDAGQPLIRIRDILRGDTATYYEGEFDPSFLARSGDLLIGMDGDFNAAVWRGAPGLLNQRVCKVVLSTELFDSRFLAHCLPGYLSVINGHTSSITVKHLSSRTIADIPLPLPPLAEQKRIADTLDELLSDLDDAVASLQRARERLKLYRTSVLKAAVEGMLTADWRAAHPMAEPASALRERILIERRRFWEEAQIARYNENSRVPPRNWRQKYREPATLDTTQLPVLPDGWCWATCDQLLWQLRSGNSASSGRQITNYPVLKSSAVRPRAINYSDLNYLQRSQSLNTDNYLEGGDFLITRLSGSVDYVGCAAVVGELPSDRIQYPDRIFCGKLVPSARGLYLSYCFNHPGIRKALESSAKSTAGHQRISISDLAPLVVPLPPLAEQDAITEAVEDQLSVIDHVAADFDAKLKTAEALRQSILRHAFTGQLVPQDTNDEPASELLERIARERVTRNNGDRSRRAAPARKRARSRRQN